MAKKAESKKIAASAEAEPTAEVSKKSSRKPAKEKSKDGALRGLRRAEAVNRQIERWKEKFDIDENASEWLKFANAVMASMEVLYAQALARVNPSKMKRVRQEPDLATGD